MSVENRELAVSWFRFFLESGIPAPDAGSYAVKFGEQRIQLQLVKELTKEHLTELGVTVLGDVIAILRQAKITSREDRNKNNNVITPTVTAAAPASQQLQQQLQHKAAAPRAVPSASSRTSAGGGSGSVALGSQSTVAVKSSVIRPMSTADVTRRRASPAVVQTRPVTSVSRPKPKSIDCVNDVLPTTTASIVNSHTPTAPITSTPAPAPTKSKVFNRLGTKVTTPAVSTGSDIHLCKIRCGSGTGSGDADVSGLTATAVNVSSLHTTLPGPSSSSLSSSVRCRLGPSPTQSSTLLQTGVKRTAAAATASSASVHMHDAVSIKRRLGARVDTLSHPLN